MGQPLRDVAEANEITSRIQREQPGTPLFLSSPDRCWPCNLVCLSQAGSPGLMSYRATFLSLYFWINTSHISSCFTRCAAVNHHTMTHHGIPWHIIMAGSVTLVFESKFLRLAGSDAFAKDMQQQQQQDTRRSTGLATGRSSVDTRTSRNSTGYSTASNNRVSSARSSRVSSSASNASSVEPATEWVGSSQGGHGGRSSLQVLCECVNV